MISAQIREIVSISDNNHLIPPSMHSLDSMLPLTVAQRIAINKQEQGTDDAFFVMDVGQVYKQHADWLKMLPRVEPHYAVKCNNDPALLRLLASLGCGFDCASKQEIETVMDLEGMTPERIIYANPCKTRNYIRLVLRIAVSDPTALCQLNVKFGCDPTTVAEALLKRAAQMKLQVVGISFHVGSGCRDPAAFGEAIAHAARLFDLGKELGHDMSLLDIGGGYPGFDSEEITFPRICSVINKALEAYFPVESGVRLIAEPGRYYAAAAFTLCCNVIAKTKTIAGKVTGKSEDRGEAYMYYINDGVYGSFNCILYDHFTPVGKPLFERKEEETVISSVWGPTCDGLDQVLPVCYLPRMKEGHWMVFHNMGAYTCAAGSEFNGFPRPNVFYHMTGKILAAKELMGVHGSGVTSLDGANSSDEDDTISVCSTVSSIGFNSDETE